MYNLLFTYKNLIIQLISTLTLSTLLYFLSLPSFLLQGLNTYIHPDDVTTNPSKPQQSGPKLAIKRPSDQHSLDGFQSLSSKTQSELNKSKKKPSKFEFDESKAQIFRLKLNDSHVFSRLYFDSYRTCFDSFVLACSSLLLHKYLNFFYDNGENDGDFDHGVLKNGGLVPIFIGVLGLIRVLITLFRVSNERSAFRRYERQLALLIGVLSFFVVLLICLGVYDWILGFEFSSIDGYGRFFVAIVSGFIAGFMYLGAGKNARAIWLGIDQIRCKLSIITCGWFAHIVFYANYLLLGFISVLWINPFSEILVNKNIGGVGGSQNSHGVGSKDRLVGNVGMAEANFVRFRLLCLLISGVFQVIALRWNLQTYLNEAVLSWYQRLHASVVPDMEYSRAKVFLHNHYLCLSVVQFFAPAGLVLLSLGLSQVNVGLFEDIQVVCVILPCSAFVQEVAIFFAWWVSFTWFVFTSTYLVLYRRGVLYIS